MQWEIHKNRILDKHRNVGHSPKSCLNCSFEDIGWWGKKVICELGGYFLFKNALYFCLVFCRLGHGSFLLCLEALYKVREVS